MRNDSPKFVTAIAEPTVAPISQVTHEQSAPLISAGSISVIIPVFGDLYSIEQCLESLPAESGRNLQVLIVDDGSPRPVAEKLDLPGIRWHRLETNHGPGHAINRGLEETAG